MKFKEGRLSDQAAFLPFRDHGLDSIPLTPYMIPMGINMRRLRPF